ncbi:MAG: MIP family channel protein [Proteobacteria bacterium]|nr:MIP family channel protein [Pseudomonadota bacterium]
MFRLALSEFIGTFIMVFAGTSAIVINDLHAGVIGHLGISLVFGLVVAAVIYTLGNISGAHINPAVTIGFWLARRLPGEKVFPYIIAQISGAITASIFVLLLFADHSTLGATLPSGTNLQSFLLEIVLTFILMLTIINVSTGSKEQGMMAGLVIGGVVALEALFAGPVSGASMNPARSIGPGLVSGNIHQLWIYIAAPVIGASLSILCCRCIREDNCCVSH